MSRFSIIALLLTLFASAQAFMVAPSFRMASRTQTGLMTPDENEIVMSKATGCVKGNCSLDEVDDLVKVLKAQQKDLFDRVEQIKKMVKSLETINTQDDREVDEIRETVRAIFRVFQLGDKASGNDYPALSKPTGWSGEVGRGPTTAYDALPPKPYKASP